MPLIKKNLRRPFLLLPGAAVLAGCDTVVLNPSGDVAAQQGWLVVQSTVLMLLIVVPVIALTLWFAWRYRQSNTDAPYTPDWDHSIQLELVIWAAPLVIIIALGALTWVSTHTLDPYRSLRRIDAERPVRAGTQPLTVEVVALDWKWLFIYPDQGIATVNQLVVPAGTPISFRLTSATVWNAFFVPQMGTMIYTMPGMATRLNLQADRQGQYEGISAQFSGDGFPGMTFKVNAVPPDTFAIWAQGAHGGPALDGRAYAQLAKPSSYVKPMTYGAVAPGLFDAIMMNRAPQPMVPHNPPAPPAGV
jgi:cytochrome o ubiquinol oxidase subunit 2